MGITIASGSIISVASDFSLSIVYFCLLIYLPVLAVLKYLIKNMYSTFFQSFTILSYCKFSKFLEAVIIKFICYRETTVT